MTSTAQILLSVTPQVTRDRWMLSFCHSNKISQVTEIPSAKNISDVPTQKSPELQGLASLQMQNKGIKKTNRSFFKTPFVLQNLLALLQSKPAPSTLHGG